MAEVPTLHALVEAFLAKFDFPQLSRDEEMRVRAKKRKLFEVADDLQKTVLRERRDNMVDIQNLTEETNRSYLPGMSAAMAEGLDEIEAMYERQMAANMVQIRDHWSTSNKWRDIQADIMKAEEERKEEKRNRREWKMHYLRTARDVGDLRSAVRALVDAVIAAAGEQEVGIAVAAVAAADVEAIDGTEAAEDLAKMAAQARAATDAAKAEIEPKSDSVSVRQRVDSTDTERKKKRKKMRKTGVTTETKMKVPKPFANKAHKPGIKEARAKWEKIVKFKDRNDYSDTKKTPA